MRDLTIYLTLLIFTLSTAGFTLLLLALVFTYCAVSVGRGAVRRRR